MKEDIKDLVLELKNLAEAQIQALNEERVNALFALQEERQRVMASIQKIDSSRVDSPFFDREEEEVSPSIREMLLKIIEIDREIKERIRTEMNGILGRLNRLEQMKRGFCQRGSGERQGKNLSLNA